MLRGLNVDSPDDFPPLDHLPPLDHFERFELAVLARADVNNVEELDGRVAEEFLFLDVGVCDVGLERVGTAEARSDVGGEEAEMEGRYQGGDGW